jgi:hypothetical protein
MRTSRAVETAPKCLCLQASREVLLSRAYRRNSLLILSPSPLPPKLVYSHPKSRSWPGVDRRSYLRSKLMCEGGALYRGRAYACSSLRTRLGTKKPHACSRTIAVPYESRSISSYCNDYVADSLPAAVDCCGGVVICTRLNYNRVCSLGSPKGPCASTVY